MEKVALLRFPARAVRRGKKHAGRSALRYLGAKRCRLGESDIVAAETGDKGVTLVLCEVKCRRGWASAIRLRR